MSLREVRPGDPLAIPASTYNAFIRAARDPQRRQHDLARNVQRDHHQSGLVLVRNESGADRDRFDVLGIDGPIIRRVDNADEFKRRVALRGVVPTEADHGGGRFLLAAEPIRSGRIGLAWASGVCIARVRMVAEEDGFADVADSDASALRSAAAGPVRLLSVEPPAEREAPGTALCIVRFGAGGGGGAAILGVVAPGTCARDPTSGEVYADVSRILSLPYYFEDQPSLLNVYFGVDPPVFDDVLVLVWPISPIQDDPEVSFIGMPLVCADPRTLIEPTVDRVVTYQNPDIPLLPPPCQ
jgi:hypothetical protein